MRKGYKPLPLFARLVGRWSVDAESGCWNWIGPLESGGYGRLKIAGKFRRASRVVWEVYRGEIPASLCVLHRCDNPRCVNTDHLYLGTQEDNMRDMRVRGRARNGYSGPHPDTKWQKYRRASQ